MPNYALTVSGFLALLAFSGRRATGLPPAPATWTWSATTTCRPAAPISPSSKSKATRWIAYIGHHGGEQPNPLTGKIEPNGTSILDVTDPKAPKYLAHIPGEGERAHGRERRRVDGARMQRQRPAARR